MILYTPMQLELVLKGLEEMEHPKVMKANVNGIPALVQDEGLGHGKLVRLLSTDPKDYINSNLVPGTIVNLKH